MLVFAAAVGGGLFILAIALFPPRVRPLVSIGPGGGNGARTVVIFPPSVGLYVTIDETAAHVAAASNVNRTALAEGLLARIYPGVGEIPEAFTQGRYSKIPGDPEPLLLLRPDAILVWPAFSDRISRVGLQVVAETDDDAAALGRLLAGVAGKPKRADFLIAQARIQETVLTHALGVARREPKPRVLILWMDGEGLDVAVAGNPVANPLKSLGAVNAADGLRSASIDRERLLRMDPDVILLPGFGGAKDFPDRIYRDRTLRPLAAVRDRRVYKMPAIGDAGPNGLVDAPLLLRWLAEILFPGRLPSRFREAFRRTYQSVYRYPVTDAQIDRAIFLVENGSSSGYERFIQEEPTRP